VSINANLTSSSAQHTRQAPHCQQQPPPQPAQPAQPPHRQARHARQPLQPRHPPQPRQASCTPLPAVSLSKRWNVARLTSAISSSPSVMACVGAKFGVCPTSAVGTAAADAPPTSEKVNPAAPNAGAAALVTRFRFEACFTRDIVASSIASKICVESACHCNCTPRHHVAQYACASQSPSDWSIFVALVHVHERRSTPQRGHGRFMIDLVHDKTSRRCRMLRCNCS